MGLSIDIPVVILVCVLLPQRLLSLPECCAVHQEEILAHLFTKLIEIGCSLVI